MRIPAPLFCAALLACPAPAASAARSELNVVLISLNTLCAGHLKTYGYGKETAPNISRLAGDGVVFESVIAQSHWTLPSLASMFTSKYVHAHGVYERGRKLSADEVTLAEAMKAGGYRTAAFTGGLDTSGTYGLSQGFDTYFDDTGEKPMGSLKELLPRALDWLAARRNDKFFLFLDSYDIHPPFDKPWPEGKAPAYAGPLNGKALDYGLLRGVGGSQPPNAEDLAYVNARYDAGITYADGFIGGMLAKLDELGLSTNTVILLTAEHGEELGSHGGFDRFGQGSLYDTSVRVPLIIKDPRKAGGARVPEQAQLIDIMPTVLDILGLPAVSGVQGRSLVPLFSGASEKDFNSYVYSEAGPAKWMIRSGAWKLICSGGKYELYDLERDSGETSDLAAAKPDMVYGLVQKLLRWRKATRTDKSREDTRVALPPEMKRKLREAGYWR